MNFYSLFRRGTAPVARERLQILLAHEREARDKPDLLDVLREEILAVISRHVAFDREKVGIKMERGKLVSTLAVDIEIPNANPPSRPVSALARLAMQPRLARSQSSNGML